MDEASSPNETSAEAVTRACEEKATPAETAGKVSAREPATFIVDEGTSDPGRKVEIRINLGFDDQSLQTLFSSLKSAHPSQPQTAEYIRLTAPFRDEAFTSAGAEAEGVETAAEETEVGEIEPFSQASGEAEIESHYVHAQFVDKAGFVISEMGYKATTPDGQTSFGKTSGGIHITLENAGNTEIELFGITNIHWSADRVKVGEEAKMLVETCVLESGIKATMELFVRDRSFAPQSLRRWDIAVNGNKVEESWVAEVSERTIEEQREVAKKGGFTCPYYFFTIKVNEYTARSGPLVVTDDVKIKLTTEQNVALADSEFRMHLCNGEIRQAKLDADGNAEVKDVIAGRHELVFLKIEDPEEAK